MNRRDLVRELGRRAGLSAADVQRTLDALFGNSSDPGLIATVLREGDEVHVQGFGTFAARARGPRPGRDPRTQEPIVIRGRRVAGFRPGSALKEALREDASSAAAPGNS